MRQTIGNLKNILTYNGLGYDLTKIMIKTLNVSVVKIAMQKQKIIFVKSDPKLNRKIV
jgi:hypothetical protein